MSYLHTNEYTLVPTQSFTVLHNCSGCNSKSHFINTNRFRVNANGSKLDVWLIYQCRKCKHTLNMPIYERVKSNSIPRQEYELFLQNDEELAEQYGKTLSFFTQNRLVVDPEAQNFELIDSSKQALTEACAYEPDTYVKIRNPYHIQLRAEKVASLVFQLSRSALKKQLDSDKLKITKNSDCWELYVE